MAIAHIDGAWVRVWGDGVIWAGGGRFSGQRTMDEIKAALEAAGYVCACKGKRGTSGEFIIDIVGLPTNCS